MAGIGATGIGLRLPFRRRSHGASSGLSSRRFNYAGVEKYTHFDVELPFDGAKGFVTLVHLAGKMVNLLL
jgi:hypothetical protein